jgi:hypothetical protein
MSSSFKSLFSTSSSLSSSSISSLCGNSVFISYLYSSSTNAADSSILKDL